MRSWMRPRPPGSAPRGISLIFLSQTPRRRAEARGRGRARNKRRDRCREQPPGGCMYRSGTCERRRWCRGVYGSATGQFHASDHSPPHGSSLSTSPARATVEAHACGNSAAPQHGPGPSLTAHAHPGRIPCLAQLHTAGYCPTRAAGHHAPLDTRTATPIHMLCTLPILTGITLPI